MKHFSISILLVLLIAQTAFAQAFTPLAVGEYNTSANDIEGGGRFKDSHPINEIRRNWHVPTPPNSIIGR